MQKILLVSYALFSCILITFLALFLYDVSANDFIVVLSCLGTSLILGFTILIYHKGRLDIFQPLIFLLLSSVLGTTLRSIYMISYRENHEVQKLFYIEDTVSSSFFLMPSIVIFFSILALVIGYSLQIRPLNLLSKRLEKNSWKEKRLFSIVFLFSLIAIIATFKYVQEMGIIGLLDSFNSFSSKRFKRLDKSAFATSLSYYRWAASLFQPAFFLLFAYFAKQKKPIFSTIGLVVILLGLSALIFPLLNSSRTSILIIMISTAMIWYYIRGASFVNFLLTSLVAVSLFMVTTVARNSYKYQTNSNTIISPSSSDGILASLVLNQNMMGVARTSHIIQKVPEQLSYNYGLSLITIFVAPIPRSFWPGKPAITPGPIIGPTLLNYKARFGGVPPGWMGELFWNFSFLGLFIGMFLTGIFLKWIYVSLSTYLHLGNLNAILLYVSFAYAFGFELIGSSFVQALIAWLTAYIPIYFAIKFISAKKKVRSTYG